MRTMLVLVAAMAASAAYAAPASKNVDAYFREFEQCRANGGDASDAHCKAMKVAMKKAKAEGCEPSGVGVDFHFERKDKTRCE